MEKLEWMFSLLDRMSGPANKIASSLKKLDPPMKTSAQGAGLFAKGIGLIGRVFGPQAAGSVLRFAGAATNLVGKLGPLKPVLSAVGTVGAKGFSVLGKGAMLATGAIVAVAAAVAVAGVGLGVAGANFAMHFLAFKEDSVAAFKAMTGSEVAANRIFMKAAQFASVTPFKESEVVAMAQGLMTRGFKESELDNLMKGVGDVGAMLGTDKMDSVINALGKMRANGKMTSESIQMLADAGINAQLVYASLGKQLGKSRAEIDQLLASGKVTDAQGVQAAMDAIANGISGGKLGGAMEEKSRTINGLLSTLAGRPEALLAHANMEPLMVPLKDFIKLLVTNLDPESPTGHRIIALFEMIGAGVGQLFGELNGSDVGGAINKILDVLEPLFKMLMGAGKGWLTVLLAGLKAIGGSLDKLTPDQVNQLVRAMTTMGEISAVVLLVVGSLVAAVLAVPFAFVYAATQIYDEFNGLWKRLDDPSQWTQIGIDIMLGIIQGFLSMSSPFTDVFNRVTGMKDLPSALSLLTGDTPPGAGAAPTTGGSGITTPVGNAPAVAPGGVGAQHFAVQMGDINVNAAEMGDDPKGHGKAAASSFKAELAAQLGNLGLSFGG